MTAGSQRGRSNSARTGQVKGRRKQATGGRNASGNPATRARQSVAPDPSGETDFQLPTLEHGIVIPNGVEVPRARLASEGSVWHYTDGNGLLGIVERNELWATSFRGLNDAAEFAIGAQIAIDLAQKIEKTREYSRLQKAYVRESLDCAIGIDTSFPSFFVASASEARDSLSQWRAYGDSGTGYCVGLDAHTGLVPRIGDDAEIRDLGKVFMLDGSHLQWGRVNYDEESQVRLIGESLAFVALIGEKENPTHPASRLRSPEVGLGWLLRFGRV